MLIAEEKVRLGGHFWKFCCILRIASPPFFAPPPFLGSAADQMHILALINPHMWVSMYFCFQMPRMALKVREPYCGYLAAGLKTAEIRSSQLPPKYLGEKLGLLQCRENGNCVLGIAVFSRSVPVSQEWLRENEDLHCIKPDALDALLRTQQQKHAWHVEYVIKFTYPIPHRSSPSVTWEKLKVDTNTFVNVLLYLLKYGGWVLRTTVMLYRKKKRK